MSQIERLPYLVDTHVHLRDLTQQEKEDFDTGSQAALVGGVVTVLDMPNNEKLITSIEQIKEKMRLASQKSRCDIGFYLGTLGDENQDFKSCMDQVYALKVYMNNTTGGFTVGDPDVLDSIFRRWDSPKPLAVHAEGDTLETAIKLADKYDRHLHVCHVSLAKEVSLIARSKSKRGEDKVTCEVTPHHLFESNLWSAHGHYTMKPPLSGFGDISVLWQGLKDEVIDEIATDHAPHTVAQKERAECLNGVTGLETTLPLLLMAERVGKINLEEIKRLTHTNPLKIFNIPEEPYENTYIEVKRGESWMLKGENLKTKPKHSPFEGRRFLDRVHRVVVRDKVVYEAGEILAKPGDGKVLP